MFDIAPLWAIFVGQAAAQIAATELGIAFRRSMGVREVPDIILSAVLVLLALLLGFAFGLSIERMDTRRALVIGEANAIGTAVLRSELLEGESAALLRARLLAYLDTRIDFFEAGVTPDRLSANYARTDAQQGELWRQVAAIARAAPEAETTALVLVALNEAFDVAAARRAAFESKDPPALIGVLMVVAVVVAAMLSVLVGPRRSRYAHILAFHLLVAGVITVVIDVDRPRSGLVLVSQAPLLELRDSLRRP